MDRSVRALSDLSAIDDQLDAEGLVPLLLARRAALREAIPGVFLAAYDVLGRVRRRPVVVAVRRAHCGGCYLRLPPQLDVSIRRRQSLSICPHCGRLLYSLPAAGENAATSDSAQGNGDRSVRDAAESKPARRASVRRVTRRQPRAAAPRKARVSAAGRSRAKTKAADATLVER